MADILFQRTGAWGIVTLNRPQALNALTVDMVASLRHQLLDWEDDGSVKAVLVKGAGDKAFCAGGDIRWMHDTAKQSPEAASAFFLEEYRVNALIHHYSKPYVSLIDGIVMGGGVGVSVHGDFRIAGDRTLFAMPETAIGLIPDVGGGYFLPRLHDGLGLYYALTGARANAADSMATGIATHYTPTDKMVALEAVLLDMPLTGTHAHADIEAVLDRFAGDPGHAEVNDRRSAIAETFLGHKRLDDLIAALQARGGEFAEATLVTLSKMSPTSMKLTFAQMARGRSLDFDSVLKMECRITSRIMTCKDFFEGVRAQIVDKDRAPKWSPATLAEVSDADIEAYFEPLGDRELKLP